MNNTDKLIVDKLKELIEKNGPGYLEDNPYAVYREAVDSVTGTSMTACAISMLLVTGVWSSAK